MRQSEAFRNKYDALKSHIITDMRFIIKERDGSALDMGETKEIPAILAGNFGDEDDPETIDELIVKKDKVIAIASSPYDDVTEYDLEVFEVPMLIAIYESVEKHIELEDSK